MHHAAKTKKEQPPVHSVHQSIHVLYEDFSRINQPRNNSTKHKQLRQKCKPEMVTRAGRVVQACESSAPEMHLSKNTIALRWN
jgi:hypothetical protein